MPDAITSFTKDIPERIARDPKRAKDNVDAVFVFVVEPDPEDGDGTFAGGAWTVDLKNSPGVTEGRSEDADCTVSMSHEVWKRVSENPARAMALFTAGEINIAGKAMLAVKLQSVIG